jgi:hypothetical protein
MSENQASFSGWARVEVMGHQTHIGFVRTEVYGQAVMFRVDQPELPERESTLTKPEYVEGRYRPPGSVVKRPAILGCTVLIGAGSIYRICPCTEEAAILAIEQEQRAELKLISAPALLAIEPSYDRDDEEEEDDEPEDLTEEE